MQYDADGDVITDNNNVSYTYDAEGRVATAGGAGAALAESDLSGNLTEEYIFFNGRRVAMRNMSTHVVSYFVLDHLGSTSVLADAAGNIINDSDYTPYGGEMPFTTGNPGQHYKFTGKERDAETGNDYFGARYFANNMGRWLSPDWSAKVEPVPYSKLDDPQSLNLYAYVGNNPMMRVDPDGHDGPDRFGCSEDQKDCNTTPPPTKKSDKQSAQPRTATTKKASTTERVALTLEATGNTVVGIPKATKGAAALVVGTLGSETGVGLAVALDGAYELTQASGQLLSAGLQAKAAITGNATGVDEITDRISASTSVAGLLGTALNHGDYHAGSKWAAGEGVFSGALTGSLVKGITNVIDTAMNLKDLVTQ